MEGGEARVLSVASQPFDVAFHPAAESVAAGLISGSIELFSYGEGDPKRLWKAKRAHKESCRAVRFLNNGQYLLSASADHSILATDVASGKMVSRLLEAHSAAINRMEVLSENTMATGDDDGTVKVWDIRQEECCSTFSAHEDFVSDMEHSAASMQLLSVSGDGTLCIYNLRRNRVEVRSENAEDELLSVTIMKHRQKVVCGTQEGTLLLYSWGHFADCSDRFPGHPNSVDALLKVDDDTLLTGSSDGLIRVVSILPNKMLGVVGEHMDYPIERLALSHDKRFLASASHDKTLKLWDVAYLFEEGGEGDGEGDGDRQGEGEKGSERELGGMADMGEPAAAMDLGEETKVAVAGESDGDDSSDEEPKKKVKSKKDGKKVYSKTPDFFSDLQ